MLFEIHDIILHRLWKRAKRKFKAYQAAASKHEALTPGQWDKYTKLTDAVYAARCRYLKHTPQKLPFKWRYWLHDFNYYIDLQVITINKVRLEHVQCS